MAVGEGMPPMKEVVRMLDMKPHPEGGYFVETYRDEWRLEEEALPKGYSGQRNGSTAIYFLLPQGDASHLHRIRAAEGWHFYLGLPLKLVVYDQEKNKVDQIRLGSDILNGQKVQHVVPSGNPGPWFGVYHDVIHESIDPERSYSLVGCTVAPGFDFRDFELLEGDRKENLIRQFPQHKEEIERLCRA